MAKLSSILKPLFSSNLRVRILSHFFLHPAESFYVRQLASILAEPVGTVSRELAKLEKAGIMSSRALGNQKHYSLRKDLPIHDDLKNIFLKTTGAGEELRSAFQKIPDVELAFLYGSFASGEAEANSDIDLMVIGDISDRKLAPKIARIERRLKREVNYMLYTRSEAAKRMGHKGDFIYEVFAGPKVILVGRADDRLLQTP